MNEDIAPHNIEAEESIIGGILLDPSAISRVIDLLTPETFYIEAHGTIYRIAVELDRADKPTDLLSVSSSLKDGKLLKQVGGEYKLVQLLERTVSAVNIDHLATLVMDKYKRRQIIALGRELEKLGSDTQQDLGAILARSETQIFDIQRDKQDGCERKTYQDYVANKFERDPVSAYPTGLTDLDRAIRGLRKRSLIVIAARASMGKTWLACYLANHIAATQNKPVVFFSAEMSGYELSDRLLAMQAGIDSDRVIQNEFFPSEVESLKTAIDRAGNFPMIICDVQASQLTPVKMRSILRQIRHERGEIGLVVLDYIQMLGDRAVANRAQAVGKISGACKEIAKEFDCPFVALAQINRGVESQNNKRPSMADIKDSGDIEQDMDLGLLLYRDEYYHADSSEPGVMEIIVAKNRNGSVGTCKVKFDPRVGRFVNNTCT